MFVIAFADLSEPGHRRLPLPFGKGESLKAVRRRVAQSCFQRAAVFASPDFVERGLDDCVGVPAVGCEDKKGVCKHIVRWRSGEVEIFSRCCSNEAAFGITNLVIELDARTPKLPPLSWITLPRSLGLYLHLNTGKWLCISGGTFNWPIKKVNNAASRLLSGVAINLLTVDKLIN